MTGRLVRKPPTNKAFNERFKIELPGFQPIKHKIEQGMLGKYYLLHEQGIYHAALTISTWSYSIPTATPSSTSATAARSRITAS